jgi:16S rRNA processing protein RimM
MLNKLNNIHSKPTNKVGFVLKPHGYKGYFKIVIEDDNYEPDEFLLIEINQKFVPYQIENYQAQSDLIKLKDFDSDSAVKEFMSCAILGFIDEMQMDDEINIIGYELLDTLTNQKFIISNVDLIPNNPLIEFKNGDKDCLLPFQDDLILDIDHDNKLVKAIIPDGLLDL